MRKRPSPKTAWTANVGVWVCACLFPENDRFTPTRVGTIENVPVSQVRAAWRLRALRGYPDFRMRVRLHSAIGYVAPLAKLEGREP
jgi:hypothetical protein